MNVVSAFLLLVPTGRSFRQLFGFSLYIISVYLHLQRDIYGDIRIYPEYLVDFGIEET
jgi:hypothetical protein